MQKTHSDVSMRDKTHMEQVERWALYVKEHPTAWKKEHTAFIDSVYHMAWNAVERIAQQPCGKEKVEKLREMRRTR